MSDAGSSSKSLERSDGRSKFLYIFSTLKGSADYILYRIDALKHLNEFNSESSSSSIDTTQQPYELHPLLVYTDYVLPRDCICVKLQSSFYFLCRYRWGQSFFGEEDPVDNTDVYMIRESDLMDLEPSEYNTDTKKYFIKRANMNGCKHNPTVFVAENKLYVLSSSIDVYSLVPSSSFEVYSPDLDTWRALLPHKLGSITVNSYVIIDKSVYFNIGDGALLSFDLEKEEWGNMTPFSSHIRQRDVFQFPPPLVPMGSMAFGFLYGCEHDVLDDSDRHCLTVCATPLPHNEKCISYEFMLPCISPDDDFLHALNSSRCPYVTRKSYENFSDYMVSLNGGKILCLISWAVGVQNNGRSLDPHISYVTLTFFEVAPGEKPLNVDYANEKAHGKSVSTRCFKAKLLQTAQYIIKTTGLDTIAKIASCFCEGF